MSTNVKDEFRNDSDGYIGVITLMPGGERAGIAVRPGDSVWLSQEEQVLTANAPRDEADNPMVNGNLLLVTEAREIVNRRPLRPTAIETAVEPAVVPDPATAVDPVAPLSADGDTEEAEEEPAEGTRPAEEEVGTPAARARRKKAAAAA